MPQYKIILKHCDRDVTIHCEEDRASVHYSTLVKKVNTSGNTLWSALDSNGSKGALFIVQSPTSEERIAEYDTTSHSFILEKALGGIRFTIKGGQVTIRIRPEAVYPAPLVSNPPRSALGPVGSGESKLGLGRPLSPISSTNTAERQVLSRSVSAPSRFQSQTTRPVKSKPAASSISTGALAIDHDAENTNTEVAALENQLGSYSSNALGSWADLSTVQRPDLDYAGPPDLSSLALDPHDPVNEAAVSVDEVRVPSSVDEAAIQRGLDRFLEVAVYCADGAPNRPAMPTNYRFYVEMEAALRLSLNEVDKSKTFQGRIRATRGLLKARNDASLDWLPPTDDAWRKWMKKSTAWTDLSEEQKATYKDESFTGLEQIWKLSPAKGRKNKTRNRALPAIV